MIGNSSNEGDKKLRPGYRLPGLNSPRSERWEAQL